MGLRYTNISGISSLPSMLTWEAMVFRQVYIGWRLRYLQESYRERATTYYVAFDVPSGGTGAIDDPIATLEEMHDLIAASSGDVRFRIKRGSGNWFGKGKNFEWTALNGGHDCAVHVSKPNITIDLYGTGAAPKFFNADPLTGSWTPTGSGAYSTDVSAYGTIDLIIETDETTTKFIRASSVANCNDTARSFYQDGNDLYVNYNDSSEPPDGLFVVERHDLSCFRVENVDDICIDLEESAGFGWGFDRADTNSHDYFFSLGPRGDNEHFVRGRAFYTSAHCMATWHAATGETGGIVTWYQCVGGHNIDNGGERVINMYWPEGGGEHAAIQCESRYPTYTDEDKVDCFHGHSSGDESPQTLAVSDRCIGNVSLNNTTFDQDDPLGCGLWVFNQRAGDDSGAAVRNQTTLPRQGVYINSEYYGRVWREAVTNDSWKGHFVNCKFSVNTSSTLSNGSRGSWAQNSFFSGTNQERALDSTAKFYHCLFDIQNNPSAGLGRGLGLQYYTIGETTSAPSGMVANRCVWRGVGDSASPAVPGIGNTDAHQIDCAYYGMEDNPDRDAAGYDSVTTTTELSADPVSFTDNLLNLTVTDEFPTNNALDLEYDFDANRRGLTDSARGPLELASLIPGNSQVRSHKLPAKRSHKLSHVEVLT